MARLELYLIIKFSNIWSTLGWIQDSSASIKTETFFNEALSHINSNLSIILFHSSSSSIDNDLALETFSYRLNSPIAVGLNTINGKLLSVFKSIRFKVLETVLSKA